MSEWLMNSGGGLLILAVIGGMVIGAACIEALRRLGRLPLPNPIWKIVAYGGGVLLGGAWLGTCVVFLGLPSGGLPPSGTLIPCPEFTASGIEQAGPTPCPTSALGLTPNDPGLAATKTPSTIPATKTTAPTETPEVKPSPTTRLTDTLTPTPTETFTATPVALPSNFNITLVFSPDTGGCGFGGSSHPFSVSIQGASMALTQVDAGITSTGTIDPATGNFSVSASGLPGTETYVGDIDFDGTTISMSGGYSYGNDPNLPCAATSSTISGTTTP